MEVWILEFEDDTGFTARLKLFTTMEAGTRAAQAWVKDHPYWSKFPGTPDKLQWFGEEATGMVVAQIGHGSKIRVSREEVSE